MYRSLIGSEESISTNNFRLHYKERIYGHGEQSTSKFKTAIARDCFSSLIGSIECALVCNFRNVTMCTNLISNSSETATHFCTVVGRHLQAPLCWMQLPLKFQLSIIAHFWCTLLARPGSNLNKFNRGGCEKCSQKSHLIESCFCLTSVNIVDGRQRPVSQQNVGRYNDMRVVHWRRIKREEKKPCGIANKKSLTINNIR